MIKRLTLGLMLFVSLAASSQTGLAHRLILGVTLGLNDPFRDYNTGTSTHELPNGDFYTRTISGTTQMPPISFDFDLTTSDRFAVGLSMIFQSHKESYTFRNAANQEVIDFFEQRHATTTAILGAKYFWLAKPNFHLGSGLGVGGSFLTVHGINPSTSASVSVDVHPLFIRYEICCGWYINLDARFTTGPIGTVSDDIIGYNVGLGVIYAFQTPSSE